MFHRKIRETRCRPWMQRTWVGRVAWHILHRRAFSEERSSIVVVVRDVNRHADIAIRCSSDLVGFEANDCHRLAFEPLHKLWGKLDFWQRSPENFRVERGDRASIHLEVLHTSRIIAEVGGVIARALTRCAASEICAWKTVAEAQNVSTSQHGTAAEKSSGYLHWPFMFDSFIGVNCFD